MRLWWSLFLVSAAWNLSAVELDGVRDFVRIQWKTEMPRPVFSVSFRVKVNAADLRVPEGKKEDNSICFEMRSVLCFTGESGKKLCRVSGNCVLPRENGKNPL